MSAEEIGALVRELRVHEIELAMENEELRQAQAELGRSRDRLLVSESRFRNLFELAPVGYVTIDSAGFIVEANLSASILLGVAHGRLAGLDLADFIDRADRDRWAFERHAVAAGAGTTVVELAGLGRRGIHAELALRADRSGDSEEAAILVTVVDVSERRRRELALRAAAMSDVMADQRERRAIAEQLHEDVNQAVAVVGMKIGTLGQMAPSGGLTELTGELTTISRRITELGSQLFPTALFNLGIAAAVQQLVESFAARHGFRSHVVEIADIEDLDEATCITLFRALRDLLSNVARRSQARTVTVRIGTEQGVVILEVEDGGLGPSEDVRPDDVPGDRVHAIGLANLQQHLSLLGGGLEVHPLGGEGSRVRVTLARGARVADR